MRKCLLIHHDFLETFHLLTHSDAGKLIVALLEYDAKGIVPDFSEDVLLNACFLHMKLFADRNSTRYEEACEKKAQAAKKRWEKIKEARVEN